MRRRARLGSAAFEQLLEGELADGSPLAHVLATARSAGTAEELAGLGAARSAFEAARAHPARRPSVTKLPAVTRTTAGRLLALKAIAAVSGVTLIGGVGYAASTTGLIEMPWHHTPAQRHGSSTPGSGAATDGAPQSLGQDTTSAGHRGGGPHPSRATTPNHGRGASVTASARAGHSPFVPPHSAPVTTPSARPTNMPNMPSARPTNTPTPTSLPTGPARTTPPARPSSTPTAPSHSHPAPPTH